MHLQERQPHCPIQMKTRPTRAHTLLFLQIEPYSNLLRQHCLTAPQRKQQVLDGNLAQCKKAKSVCISGQVIALQQRLQQDLNETGPAIHML